jgi:hypothetical protein
MFARIRHYIGQICNGQIHRLAFCTAVKFVVSLFVRGQIRQFTGQICRFLSFPFFVLVKFVVCWSNVPFSVVPIFCTGQIRRLLVKFAVFCRSHFLYWSNLQFAGQICRFLSFPFSVLVKFTVCWSNLPFSVVATLQFSHNVKSC